MSSDTDVTAAELAADRLRRRFGLNDPGNLVLEDLAMALGVVVVDAELRGAEARLVAQGTRGLIRVNRAITEPGRRRFAIAHELGHWSHHRSTSQLNMCLTSDVIGYRGGAEELEANAFASHLLLPGKYLREHYATAPSLDLVRAVADDLLTSLSASAVRLVEVATDSCLVVFSDIHTRQVQWWRRAPKAPKVWLERKQALSERTVARELAAGGSNSEAPEEIAAEAWFPHVEWHDELVVYEESMRLGGYPTILTLLAFDYR